MYCVFSEFVQLVFISMTYFVQHWLLVLIQLDVYFYIIEHCEL